MSLSYAKIEPTPLYSSVGEPYFLPAAGGVITGSLTVDGAVYAGTGLITNGGGGLAGVIFQDPVTQAQEFRLQHLAPPNARSIIQTNDPLFFNQVGTAQGNTNLVISTFAPANPQDVLTVGGAVCSVGDQGFRVFEAQPAPTPPVLKMVMANGANQSYIQSDDVLYFSRLGGSAQTSLAMNVAPTPDVLTVGGTIQAKALDLEDTGGAAVVGNSTLVAGQAIVTTTASDVTAYIFLTRTDLNASTAVGELRIVNQIAGSFTVESVDNTGALETNDVSSFHWMIVNPV